MKFFIFLFCIISSELVFSGNICREQNTVWYVCEKKEDCIIIPDPCGYPLESSNKNFSNMAEKCNRIAGAAMSCATWTEMQRPKVEADCVAKVCTTRKR